MTDTLTIIRPMRDGKPVLSNEDRQAIQNHYRLFQDGDAIEMTIKKHRHTRTNPQLRYYFGVVVKMLSEELGYHVDEMHELLKHMFNPKMIDVKGYCVELGGSTGDLKTNEMEDYMAKIRMWASTDLSIFIPLPNEAGYDY